MVAVVHEPPSSSLILASTPLQLFFLLAYFPRPRPCLHCLLSWHNAMNANANAMIMISILILQQQQDSPMPMLEAGTNLFVTSLEILCGMCMKAHCIAAGSRRNLVEVCFGRKALMDETEKVSAVSNPILTLTRETRIGSRNISS